ncbi:MAG: MFS transporter [Rhodobacteraceae bacterium]|nr:MFS transporter [Paracoccaceae bacterium]
MTKTAMGRTEFIALIAMMMATIAFSIDAMLPALPEIARELTPDDLNRAQLIVVSFVLGMGAGTMFTGPLSDAVGRRPVIMWGAALYCLAAALAWVSTSLELVLVARVIQGIGAAGPRVVSVAIIRDLYKGREMARLMSVAMVIFSLFPAVAPLIGSGVIALAGWRGIFLVFMGFAVIMMVWMGTRLSETLPVAHRRPMRLGLIWLALREMFAHPVVRLSIMVQTLSFGMLFAMIATVQPVYDRVFGMAESFPLWFGAVVLISASASVLNAMLVVRLGMRAMITWTLAAQVVVSGVMTLIALAGLAPEVLFVAFLIWQATVFLQAGTTIGNLNAIAMEPMGHIAGMAASVIGSVATVASALLATPIALLFNGTLLPLTLGIWTMAVAGLLLMMRMRRLETR